MNEAPLLDIDEDTEGWDIDKTINSLAELQDFLKEVDDIDIPVSESDSKEEDNENVEDSKID